MVAASSVLLAIPKCRSTNIIYFKSLTIHHCHLSLRCQAGICETFQLFLLFFQCLGVIHRSLCYLFYSPPPTPLSFCFENHSRLGYGNTKTVRTVLLYNSKTCLSTSDTCKNQQTQLGIIVSSILLRDYCSYCRSMLCLFTISSYDPSIFLRYFSSALLSWYA